MEPLLSVSGYLRYPSLIDFPGCVSSILFFPGCNFTCGYCHNHRSLSSQGKGLSKNQLERVLDEQKLRHWTNGAVLSGGEPTIFPDIQEIISIVRSKGLQIKLDTNGSQPEVLSAILDSVDYVAMDIKSDAASYGEVTGFEHTEAIQESIHIIMGKAADYEFRTTVIPGIHTPQMIEAISSLIPGASRYMLQTFIPREDLPDPAYRMIEQTSPQLLNDCRKAAARYVSQVGIR